MKAIVTIPPYAPYVEDIAKHPLVEGLRLNTVMPIKESLEELLESLKQKAHGKDIWIDLKCRQLRIKRGVFYDAPTKPTVLEVGGKKVVLDPQKPKAYGNLSTPPWSIIELDHEIELDTTNPVRCYFNDGYSSAYIAKVNKNKLIMLDGPQKVVGGGESVNILDPSLKIKGYLTENDKKYIEAAKKVGIHNYMLSFVEKTQDIEDLLALDPDANIAAKIESQKGLAWMANHYQPKKKLRLMAARGDLYVEVDRPHNILRATRSIIRADKNAIAASRICTSLRNSSMPDCHDITDIGYQLEIGYKHFMVGDDVCFNRSSVMATLNLMYEISKEYQPRKTMPLNQFKKLYGGNAK